MMVVVLLALAGGCWVMGYSYARMKFHEGAGKMFGHLHDVMKERELAAEDWQAGWGMYMPWRGKP